MRLLLVPVVVSVLLNNMYAETGTIRFESADGKIPEHHRLDAHTFDFELTPKSDLPVTGVSTYSLKFPSAVESPHVENNTVYAEYFRPNGPGPFPAVIVLDILDGSEVIPRTQANLFAQNNIAALHVKMAYYGQRRPLNSRVRLLSMDVPQTLAAVRQTVLDLRRAVAWLESRPEIDGKKLGIVGTSLGSFLAALTAESEPKISKVALLYGGGGFVEGYSQHPMGKPYFGALHAIGISKPVMKQMIATVDPLTHADELKNRDVLMIAAKRDDIVPPTMAKMLWEASGKPKIVWYDTTHVGAALFAVPAIRQVLQHFQWK